MSNQVINSLVPALLKGQGKEFRVGGLSRLLSAGTLLCPSGPTEHQRSLPSVGLMHQRVDVLLGEVCADWDAGQVRVLQSHISETAQETLMLLVFSTPPAPTPYICL